MARIKEDRGPTPLFLPEFWSHGPILYAAIILQEKQFN
jgi:hypothetical protein